MKKILVVTGTRAEYGLLRWVIDGIAKSNLLELQLCVTGMHLSPEFGLTYKEIEKDVERILRTEFMSNLARTNRRDSHELMADIFNSLDRSTETRFFAALEERNMESASKIKSLMFTFDDLMRLDSAGVQVLMRQVDKDRLTMALKGASEDMKKLFFGSMSNRASKLMKDDMTAMGAVRLSEVEEAQTAVVAVAKDLTEKGEIVLEDGAAGSDMLIE